MEQLTERSQVVLRDIVDIYTETGTPVGSKALCERSSLNLSSASLRNVMSDLEANGYLASPHTSAGRIPTEAGFRFYAQSLVEVSEDELDDDLKRQIEERLTSDTNLKDALNDVSAFLGQVTECTGVVAAPRLELATLDHIEFLRIQGDKVLAVMVTKTGDIENRLIDVPEGVTIDQLNESAKHLKDVVDGKTLADARVDMMQELMAHKNHVDNMMNEMLTAADSFGEAKGTDTALVVSGTQNLFQYPELVRDQLKSLFQAFEEKRMLMALMNRVQKGDGVQIFVGADCALDGADGCSMITSSYGTADRKVMGTLGVVGPVRMNYKKAIQLVDYTGKVLSRVLEERGMGELNEQLLTEIKDK